MKSNDALVRLQAGITVIDDFFDRVFAPLHTWVPALCETFESELAQSGKMSGSRLAQLVEEDAKSLVTETDFLVYGAGFCASDVLVDSGNPLAWWQGHDLRLLASSTFGPGQAEIDLSRLEWYRVPRSTLKPHIAGPFVDYLCSNEVTVTLTVPVIIDDQFAGVACADLLVTSLEKILEPQLDLPPHSALLNAQGRIVLSSNFDGEPGDRHPVATYTDAEALEHGLSVARSDRYPYMLATRVHEPAQIERLSSASITH